MQSLIEQVKRLAEAKAHYARTGSSVLFDELARDKLDWEHLLAHMQAQQAVVDAAKKARQIALNAENVSSASALGEHIADIFNCLDAALKEPS